MPAPQALQTDEAQVLVANQTFYDALAALSVEKMVLSWWHDDWVSCLHPGWDLLVGWVDILESWRNIFSSTMQMRVDVSRPLVRVQGDVAWVSCIESVTSTYDAGFETAVVESTNILLRRNGDWRMVHHHATPLPNRVPSGTSQRIQ